MPWPAVMLDCQSQLLRSGWLQRWVSIAIFMGTMIALYWGLVCSYGRRLDQKADTRRSYLTSIRWLCCMLIFSCINVAKSLLAKVMSAHFYVEGYFDRMQSALRQVRLPALMLPALIACRLLSDS